MNTEEKILHYMDGTLNEPESGELLHSLSVSPEKRVVLEQHIKLRELTSLAQKPVPVPQALEANMAERFPAIAQYNREIGGGAVIIEQAARPSFIGRMAASVAAFIGQYPVRTGFALAAASVIGYFALRGADQKADVALTDRPSRTSATTATTSNSGADLHKGNNISPRDNTPANTSKASSSSNTFSVKHHSNRADISSLERSKVRSTVSSSEHLTPNQHNALPREDVQAKDNDMQDAPVNVARIPDEKKNGNTVNAINDNTNAVKDFAAITSVSDIRSEKNISFAENNIHGNRTEQNPFREKDENSGGFPFAVRFYGSLGGSFVNVHQNDAVVANRTEASALLGLDYIANPYVSAGIEGGNAAISQLITQSAIQSNVGGLPSISRVVVNNAVTSSSQFYARAVVHYTFNPFDMIHFEGTLGAGAAFASKTAPLVSAALFAGYDLSSHVGISAGIAFAGAWTGANAQQAAQQNLDSADPIGYVTVNHASATLFTPSYGLRVGLKVKPW